MKCILFKTMFDGPSMFNNHVALFGQHFKSGISTFHCQKNHINFNMDVLTYNNKTKQFVDRNIYSYLS